MVLLKQSGNQNWFNQAEWLCPSKITPVKVRNQSFQTSAVKLGEHDENRKRSEAVSGRAQTAVHSRKTASDMFVPIWFRDLAAFHIGVILQHVQKMLCLTLPEFQV